MWAIQASSCSTDQTQSTAPTSRTSFSKALLTSAWPKAHGLCSLVNWSYSSLPALEGMSWCKDLLHAQCSGKKTVFKQETQKEKKCLVNSLGPEALVGKHMVRITSQSKADQLTVDTVPCKCHLGLQLFFFFFYNIKNQKYISRKQYLSAVLSSFRDFLEWEACHDKQMLFKWNDGLSPGGIAGF